MATPNTIPPAPAETAFTDPRGRITVPWRAWLNQLVSLGGTVAALTGDYLSRALNLSDLTNVPAARTNLGLGSAATHDYADFDPAGAASSAQAAAIAASDPVGSAAAVLASSLQKASNLSDVASASTARTNLGLGSAATHASTDFDAAGAAAAAQAASLPVSTVLPANTPAVSHQFVTAYSSTTGAFTQAQPAAADVSGLAASATTDTTNATNISSGTLADARLSSNIPLKNAANTFTAAQTVNATSGPGLLMAATTTDALARVANDGTATYKSTLQLYRSATDYGEITFWPGGSGLRINNARSDTATGINFQQQGTTKVTIAGSTGALLVNTTTDNAVDKLQVNGHIATVTAGNGIKVKEGTNARMGTGTLTAGTVTISNTSITATTRIFVTNTGGGANVGALYVSARVAGTSFTVTSTNALDTSTLNWFLVEPA